MRRHKGITKCPKQKTTQARKTTHNPGNHHNCQKYRGTTPDQGRCTRYGALHPNRRGALPTDRVQRPNTQEQTRNWHTEPLTAAPLHAQPGPGTQRFAFPGPARLTIQSGLTVE